MERLINFRAPEVQTALPVLLQDKSTKCNIIWATDPPEALQNVADDKSEITIPQLQQMGYEAILPRMMKQADTQQERTRKKGEVFSPAWVCNKMNNALDADWFGPDAPQSLFTEELPQSWQSIPEPVPFDKSHKWEKYVDSRRLEVTCGEAPFLASRYDAATGKMIPVDRRIGILDRKLRIVGENTSTEADWLKWAIRAMQSTYGYEYQGDNLLLARTNLLLTFIEYLQDRWRRSPTTKELKTVANIIAWNVWQMDGLHLSVPGGKPQSETEQLDLFSMFGTAEEQPPTVSCKVKDWRANRTQDFETIQEGSISMKFDYVIGNPPYQDETLGDNKGYAPPVYNKFLDASYEIADRVEMIHPARFLFNAGSTPKAWNEKMLNDPHFKVLDYEADASKLFHDTDIKGGVVISYRNRTKTFGAIQVFTKYKELNTIRNKVWSSPTESIMVVIYIQNRFDLMNLYREHPECKSGIGSDGRDSRFEKNIFVKIPLFKEEKFDGSIKTLGIYNGKRTWRYIDSIYVDTNHENLKKYKVVIPAANGSGEFGQPLSAPVIEMPMEAYTRSFIGIGAFDTKEEAEALLKYIKSKFLRAMLSVLKVTQMTNKDVWKYVPLQDFTSHSDIDWSKSIAEIDQQLYRKYGLTADEINFIETHVKEMA